MSAQDRQFDLSRPLAELHPNEQLKHESRYLRGTLREGLADEVTGAVSEPDTKLTKFFGIYQQDDRDTRDERRRAKLEPDYQFMVRIRLPGGVCTPAQWLGLQRLADRYGNGTLRLTSRQTFQFHRIRKRNLQAHLRGIRDLGLDTIAACGDDNRNVICTANPLLSDAHASASRLAQEISSTLKPRTGAYREIYLGESVPEDVGDVTEEEPFYGRTYLPRKFKIAIALPPDNDVDVFAHDLGFIAIIVSGRIVGYNVVVGGGMGMTHQAPATYPRLGDVIGFAPPEEVVEIAFHTMCIQRDFGNRKDRSHARFKYTIADRGLDWFTQELARRRGRVLQPARRFFFESSGDRRGWYQGSDGRWHFTVFVENGRVVDRPGRSVKSALCAIAERHSGLFALTTNQNVIIAGIEPNDRPAIANLLRYHGLDGDAQMTAARERALACVALPTCGLAMAESERYLPRFMDKLDALLREYGLADRPISVRMSGCPNGCSRPYLAEIALVGKGPGRYNLHLGGDPAGMRLNALFLENVGEQQIFDALKPLLGRYSIEALPGESFGPFLVRQGVVPSTKDSKTPVASAHNRAATQ